MASITSFIRNTPAASLRAYFITSGIELPSALDWDAPEPDVVRPLLQAVDDMDDAARGRVVNDADRVGSMSDDAGQVAIYSVIDDRAVLDGLANPYDRALWMFLNQRVQFQHAEEVRFTDERRRGRSWDGFICDIDCAVRRDPISVDAFRAALRERFASSNIHVDIFERVRPTFDGEDCELVQITVYREGLPDDHFAFDDGGELVRRAYRPVFEAAMTYEPSTGVIEVVANDRESRAELAQFLARHLLGVEFSSEKVPMRQYDLSVLLNRFAFPTDLEDGIERVDVRQLRLMPIDHEGRRVTFENAARAGGTIWDMADEEFGATNPLRRGWVITQAKLAIKFHPKGDARRGRSLGGLATGAIALRAECGPAFFADLAAHKEVRETYLNTAAAADLRSRIADEVSFGGITFRRYRGGAGFGVATDKAVFYPEAVDGLFEIYHAPADTFETVNTLGQPLYARMIPDRDRDEWVRLEIESNPLPICTRPQVLRSARRT